MKRPVPALAAFAVVAGVAAFAGVSAAMACALGLEGRAEQGGLLIGTAPKGSEVSFAGRKIRVSPEGKFIIGFSRDAKPKAALSARRPDGGEIACTLDVAKRSYKVQRIDGLPQKKVSPDKRDMTRIKAEQKAINEVRWRNSAAVDFLGGFGWPLKGRISGVWGSQRILNGKPRRPHFGIDIAAPTGTPILAPAAGTVALVHPDMFFTGKSVMLDHGHGLTSIYVHMSAISVKPGQRLARGQEIGKVGMTGRATGPHLHWGVALFSTQLDPALLAGKMPK